MITKENILEWAEAQSFTVRPIIFGKPDCYSIYLDELMEGLTLTVGPLSFAALNIEANTLKFNRFPKSLYPRSVDYFKFLIKDIGEYNETTRTVILKTFDSIGDFVDAISLVVSTLIGDNFYTIKFISIGPDKFYLLSKSDFISQCCYTDNEGYKFKFEYSEYRQELNYWLCPEDAKSMKCFAKRLKKFFKDFYLADEILQKHLGPDYKVCRYKWAQDVKILISHGDKIACIEALPRWGGYEVYYPHINNKLRFKSIKLGKLNNNISLDLTPIVDLLKLSLT